MIHLLNSAMMPQPGIYRLKALSREKFAEFIQTANNEGVLRNYIGYPSTAKIIQQISDVEIPISREETILQNGDEMLICKLKYRLQNPGDKLTHEPNVEDFEFFYCTYMMIE